MNPHKIKRAFQRPVVGVRQWYRGKRLSEMQKMVARVGGKNVRKAMAADNAGTKRLVINAGVLPPVLTTAVGIGATVRYGTPPQKPETPFPN